MISQAFSSRPAFIAYVTGGDGGLNYTLECSLALVEGGIDMIEIGIPFTDPVADGPIIQGAMMRSLANKTTPEQILAMIGNFKKRVSTPVILFSYYNPLMRLGSNYLDCAARQGVDGVLIIDLPIEEPIILPKTIQRILVASASTSNERLESIGALSQGFIYYACQKGTTGMRSQLPENFDHDVKRIKERTRLPVAAGFGISSRETAENALRYADGFIVGSYFVKAMEQKVPPEKLRKMAQNIDPRRIL